VAPPRTRPSSTGSSSFAQSPEAEQKETCICYNPPVIEMKVSPDAAGQRLDKFLRRALKDVPLSHIFKLLRTRKVRVNGARGHGEQLVVEGDAVVVRGDEEQLLRSQRDGEQAPGAKVKVTFQVLFEDEHLLAVNKPAGLAAHPGTGITGATLVEEARAYLKVPAHLPSTEFKPSPAHRLDRETSGVVLVAKTRKCMARFTELFTSGEGVRKSYLALAKGKMPRAEGTVELALSEHEQTARSKSQRGVKFQEATTHYRVVSSMREASLLQLRIETGRTHQIRRHLQAIGHPVAGDARYGDFPFNRAAKTRWGLRRMFLHAWKLELPHPMLSRPLRLEAPVPEELLAVLGRMNLGAPLGAGSPTR
jgi:23S rRNA pseudouridine955/2504/2580 synthase